MNIEQIYSYLLEHSSEKFREFSRKLIFTNSDIIGVKMDVIRSLAKKIANDDVFIPSGVYFEYDTLKSLIICYRKEELSVKLNKIIDFSLTIDNWSVSDTIACSVKFKEKDLDEVFDFVKKLLIMEHNFSRRLGVVFLMKYFINYDQEVIFNLLKDLPYGDYYLDMAVAWYYSVLIAKNYEVGVRYVLKYKEISNFVYKKSIQKAIESFRVSNENKEELRKLRK